MVNDALGANFDPTAFEHVAFFDARKSWIEMRLRALAPQRVAVPGAGIEVEIAAGEDIRTEISAKFTVQGLRDELCAAGLRLESFMADPSRRFGLALAARS